MILLTTVVVVTILLTKVDVDAPIATAVYKVSVVVTSAFVLLNNVTVDGAMLRNRCPMYFFVHLFCVVFFFVFLSENFNNPGQKLQGGFFIQINMFKT